MDRREFLVLATALGAGACLPACSAGGAGTAEIAVPGPDASASPLDSGLMPFAGRLTRRLAPAASDVVWSPWSVGMVLAMIRCGAAGQTAAEFSALLGAGVELDAQLADGLRRLTHATGEPMHAANAVWAQRGPTWKKPFLDRLAGLYAVPREADFVGRAPAEVLTINRWVADRTADKITELVNDQLVDSTTRLVLVNAVHFKADWQEPLVDLGPLPFGTPAGPVRVPTVSASRPLNALRGRGWSGAMLPCKGGEFGLVVILPDDPSVAPSSIDQAAFPQVAAAPARAVALTMPAWKLRYRRLLTEALQAEGLVLAFDPDRADFSGMTGDVRLFLSFVVHEATVEITSGGIEAAAATAGGMNVTSAPVDVLELTIDRPFAWALLHLRTSTPLFIGQVSDPTRQTAG